MFFPHLILILSSLQAPVNLQSGSKPPAAPSPATVVASVNGNSVTAGEVEPYLWQWLGKQAVQEVVGLKIVEEAAKKEGVSASDAEILARLSQDIDLVNQQKKSSQNDPAPNESAVDYLAEQGFPLSRLYMRSEIEVLSEKMAEKTFDPNSFVDVSTAIFRVGSEAATAVANAAERANNGYKELTLGVKWIEILKATGAPESMLQNGGHLGWRQVSAFPPAVQSELKTLSANSYTKPVQTAYGFQIFKVNALGSKATPAELADLKKEYLRTQSQLILTQLKETAKVTYSIPGSK